MFGILLAGVGDHMGTVLRQAVAKIETLFLVRMVTLNARSTNPPQEPFSFPSRWCIVKISGG